MAKKKYIEWNKCVHIHACRRLCAIIKRETGRNITRGCGEKCSAYSEYDNERIMEELNDIINNAESAYNEISIGAEENDCTNYALSLLDEIKYKAENLKVFFEHGKDNY